MVYRYDIFNLPQEMDKETVDQYKRTIDDFMSLLDETKIELKGNFYFPVMVRKLSEEAPVQIFPGSGNPKELFAVSYRNITKANKKIVDVGFSGRGSAEFSIADYQYEVFFDNAILLKS